MRRIFGAAKNTAPAPTLDESCERMDLRNDRVEDKIKKLEDQLMRYREQIRKTRPGAAQDAIKRRAIQLEWAQHLHGLPQLERAQRLHGLSQLEWAQRLHGLPQLERARRLHGLPQLEWAQRLHGLPQLERAQRLHGLPQLEWAQRLHGLPQLEWAQHLHGLLLGQEVVLLLGQEEGQMLLLLLLLLGQKEGQEGGEHSAPKTASSSLLPTKTTKYNWLHRLLPAGRRSVAQKGVKMRPSGDQSLLIETLILIDYGKQLQLNRKGAQDAIKWRAIQLMKQKKLYEGQQSTLMAQQFNMEQTRFTMDNIKDTVGTVAGLSAAQKEMKGMMKNQKELDLNYIDKMQDKMFDMMDISNEINETMSRSYNVPDDLDESDLMAELDGLEGDMSFGEAVAGGAPSYLQEPDVELPSAPTQQPEASEQELGLPAMKT